MIGEHEGSHNGTEPLCELGSVSGKGSRPENLGSITSKIVSGRNRSIRMVGQYEDEYQVDSRKGTSMDNLPFEYREYEEEEANLAMLIAEDIGMPHLAEKIFRSLRSYMN